MNRTKKLTAVAAGVGALVLVAGPAFAGPPFTISAGSQTSGSVSYTAQTDANGVYFEANGVPMSCDWATAHGYITLGSDSDGLAVGTIDGSDWGNGTPASPSPCIGPASLPMEVTQVGTWDLNLEGAAGGVTQGSVSNIQAHVENPDGFCSFDVTGTADGYFDESNQTLTIDNDPSAGDHDLVVSNVVDCFGLLDGGPHEATFIATFDVSNSVGAIDISD